ncbi:hypothetical protein A0H81_12481 [Grifola frondosa]|uniref:Uncharacterized protein n=1 Tax=Grifola frondosa TaxID=5627 RepID=A0A1C7LT55_GRIFR|nr:hypothetical protein A0H81_12481 [Grifola frondosa]
MSTAETATVPDQPQPADVHVKDAESKLHPEGSTKKADQTQPSPRPAPASLPSDDTDDEGEDEFRSRGPVSHAVSVYFVTVVTCRICIISVRK